MKMNTYTLETYKKQGKPIFCLVIKSEIYHSVLFFTDMQTLKDRLNYEQKSLFGYGIELEYEKEKLKLIVKIKILDKDLKEVQISTIHSNVDNATANMIKQKLKEVEKEGIPCKTNF